MLTARPLATWLALLALTQAGDVATTWAGGLLGAREENPLVRGLLAHGDVLAFALLKLALVAAMAGFVLAVRARLRSRFVHAAVWRGLQLLVVAFTLVAGGNALGIVARLGGLL